MEILGCIAVFVIIWLFVSPVLSLALWKRVRELEDRVRELARQLPSRPSIAVTHESRSRSNDGFATTEQARRPNDASRPDPVVSPYGAAHSESADLSRENGPQSELASTADEPDVLEILEDVPMEPGIPARPVPLMDPVPEQSDPVAPVTMAADTSTGPIESHPNVPQLTAAERGSIASAEGPTTGLPVTSARPNVSLEEILAAKWLAYVGALAVMIGAGFGLKYAIDNQWLGPAGRVVMGVISGLLCFAGGAFAMRKDYRFLGQSLTGAALGILYSSFYAAFNWYHVLPYEWAFAGMVLTTAGGLTFAHAFDSQPTAFLGMIGGFLTPAMLPPTTDSVWELFPYLLLLDVGVLAVSSVRRWTGLQVLVFFGTIFTWVVWYNNFFKPELLPETLGFLVAFFALFAALGVIHNIVQKRIALAADFFLILATPSVFFAALYWLTYEIWPYEQGYFALVMTAVYASLAVYAARINPIGKSTTAALAGLAGTFLILAPPLSLTGHWVTVAWIAESVLLVELGLRYDLKSLTWTGLSLLAKVQCILIIYGIGTLVDPLDFQTAFVRQRLHLSVPIEQPALAWTDVFNNRSYSYLVDAFALAILAWEYRRRVKANLPDDPYGPRQRDLELLLASGVPIVGLLMGLLEIFVWGTLRHWEPTAILSACAIWTSLVAAPTVAWAVHVGPRGLERIGWVAFAVLTLLLGFNTAWTVDAVNSTAEVTADGASTLWLINSRGFGFLFALAAMICAAMVYARDQSSVGNTDNQPNDQDASLITMDQLFGGMAYWFGLVMVLLETYVWGLNHRWRPETILSAFIAWSSAFALGLILWQTDWRFVFSRLTAGTNSVDPERVAFRTYADMDFMASAIFSIVAVLLAASAFQTIGNAVTDVRNTLLSSEGALWLINPRGLSFLSACAAGAISAWLLEHGKFSNRRRLSLIVGSSTYLSGLTCVLLETLVWGTFHDWRPGTILSCSAIWTAAFAAGLIVWRVRLGSQSLDKLVIFSFLVLGNFLLCNSIGSFAYAAYERSTHVRLLDELWLFNPRGVSFLVAIAAAALTASLYRLVESAKNAVGGESTSSPEDDRYSINFFATTFLGGLVLLLLETNVWGMPHGWLFGTLVSSSAIWIAIFSAGCAFWAASSRNPLPGQLMVGVFVFLGVLVSISGVVPFAAELNDQGAAVHGPGYDLWLLNPRGVGFLMAIAAASLSAILYQLMANTTDSNGESHVSQQSLAIAVSFGVAAFFGGLILVNLETIVWGLTHGWLFGTLVSTSAMWTSIFGAGLAICVASSRTRDLDRLVVAVYILLGGLIFVAGVLPFDQSLKNSVAVEASEFEWWFLNPRGFGYLFGIAATGLAAAMYRRLELQSPSKPAVGAMTLSQTLGVSAYLAGFALVTTEAFAQGTTRHWMTGTSLAITIAWTLYATGTIVAGIYWRAATVRILALSLFVLTIGKVFLIDIWHLETVIRVFAFLSLGVALMLISFLYRRFRERIRNWVLPTTPAASVQ